MPADAQVDVVAADFDRAWTEECRAHADAPSMIRVLWNLHGWVSVLGFFYWSCGTAAVIITPIFMKNLIQYGVECLRAPSYSSHSSCSGRGRRALSF